jgi:hypothetical protein
MNIYKYTRPAVKSASLRLLFAAAITAGVVFPAASHAEDIPKTQTLFMGADVTVGTDKALHPVKDVIGGSWVIDVKGQPTVLSTKHGPINMKVTPALKLTEISASIVDFKNENAYSFGNDPSTRLTRAMSSSASLNNDSQAATNQARFALIQAQNQASYITGTNNNDTAKMAAAGEIGGGYMGAIDGATNANSTTVQLQAALNQTAVGAGSGNEMVGDRGTTLGYDAVDVTFKVSSAHRLNNPYVVTVARLRDKGAQAGYVRSLVYAKSIDPIDSQQVTVHFTEEGYPPGFEMIDFKMHLYDRGEEVATNLASNRVELTRDEAFEYVKMEYIGAHKGDTLAAEPAMGRLPQDFPARLAEGKYAETIYVRVSKDGLATEAYSDRACTKRVGDPYLDSVVAQIRFKPALDVGRPVDGTASVRLDQLKI